MEPIRIDPENFLRITNGGTIADVRTPLEYSKGHIPGAYLFPIFTNEERAELGKLYALYGGEKAVEKGYQIARPKLNNYVKEANRISPSRCLSIYCWRGGMRSASLAWLLGFSGFNIEILEGGYKAYRRFCHNSFEKPSRIVLLGGYTGTGKTELLSNLEKNGEQVINLEALSNHKGSAFGWIGENQQTSQEQFENNLAEKWKKLDPGRTIWMEDESINIGKIQIPRPIFTQMEEAPIIVMETDRNTRIDRLVRDYQSATKEELITVFNRIRKRIGMRNSQLAIDALERNELQIAAAIALEYYDKVYAEKLKMRNNGNLQRVTSDENPEILVSRILECCAKIDE